MVEVERFRRSEAKNKRGPARGGVDRASSRGIIGKNAAEFQVLHIMLL
jgi:hypothetical protein